LSTSRSERAAPFGRVDRVFLAVLGLIVLVPVAQSAAVGPAGVGTFLLWILEIGACVIVGALWVGAQRAGRRSNAARCAVTTTCAVGVILSVAAMQWPMRLVHAASRPWLDDAVLRVRAGEAVGVPSWIGLARVQRIDVCGDGDGGYVCFWTDVNPTGPSGFVQKNPGLVPFNYCSDDRVDLSDGWYFISED